MGSCMRLKALESCLQAVCGFESPKIELEQYGTPVHIASCMLHSMQASYGDIAGKLVADLGAGCGILSIGAAILEAGCVISFETDNDALITLKENSNEMEIDNIDVIHCNIINGIPDRWNRKFDTVVMNPPFGTKHNAGIDMIFLQKAADICNGAIYSLHKSSTRSHIKKRAKELNLEPKVLAELKYDLPSTYKFHKKSSVDIHVDFWRFQVQ